MPRGWPFNPDENADILATLAPTSVRMAALCERTGRTPGALRKQYQRLRAGEVNPPKPARTEAEDLADWAGLLAGG